MKHKITLRRILIRFLLMEILGAIILAGIVAFAGWNVLMHQLTHPADKTEQEVDAWIKEAIADNKADLQTIPDGCDLILYEEGEILYSNCTKEEEETIRSIFAQLSLPEERSYLQQIRSTRIYREYVIGTQVLQVSFLMEADYTSPDFQRNMIFATLAALVITQILWLLVTTGLTAGKISRELKKLSDASKEIAAQNLDFQVKRSNITEIDEVAQSFEIMKDQTRESLKTLWRSEKDRKKAMVELAHQIKTSLTVIRGNTDLLLETHLTDQQAEYVETMRKRESEIISYALQIVEDNKE